MALTDVQLIQCFTWISDSNGRHCNIVLRENGLAGTERICGGRSVIENGKVVITGDTCGEPCSFICDNVRHFSEEVERIKAYDALLCKVKR